MRPMLQKVPREERATTNLHRFYSVSSTAAGLPCRPLGLFPLALVKGSFPSVSQKQAVERGPSDLLGVFHALVIQDL